KGEGSTSSTRRWRALSQTTRRGKPTVAESPAPHTVLQPPGWPQPKGFANGIRARGEMVFVGGMIGQDKQGRFAAGFVAQMKQTPDTFPGVLAQAGPSRRHIARLTWSVRDMDEYRPALPPLAPAYREVMGRHSPAMAVVEVNRLVEPEARLEIEATAVLP